MFPHAVNSGLILYSLPYAAVCCLWCDLRRGFSQLERVPDSFNCLFRVSGIQHVISVHSVDALYDFHC